MCLSFCSNPSDSALTEMEVDLVYFVKKDGTLTRKWTIGMGDSVLKGRNTKEGGQQLL